MPAAGAPCRFRRPANIRHLGGISENRVDAAKQNYISSFMITTASPYPGTFPNGVEQAAEGFAALGSPSRLALLRILVRTGEDGLTIGRLQKKSGLAASTLAHHIRALANCGLVIQNRQGREVITQLNYSRVSALSRFLICECCSDARTGPARNKAVKRPEFVP